MYYNYKNKPYNIQTLNRLMLNKTVNMFEYEGLPETIPALILEKFLQTHGHVYFYEVNGDLYIFKGSFGGELDVYERPEKYIIVNTALDLSKTVDLDEGVLMKNDSEMLGMLPILNKYNTLLIENEITMYLHTFNSRIQTLISAGDDKTKESAELYLKRLKDGELGVIGENALFDGVRSQSVNTSGVNTTSGLIELNQYIRATLFHEVGMNANYNMKRERLNTSEVELNDDSLKPLIHNMLIERQQAVEKINEKYNLNIEVKLSSVWGEREEEDQDLDQDFGGGTEETETETGIETLDETVDETDHETVDETEDETEDVPEVEEMKRDLPEDQADDQEEDQEEKASSKSVEHKTRKLGEEELDDEEIDDVE